MGRASNPSVIRVFRKYGAFALQAVHKRGIVLVVQEWLAEIWFDLRHGLRTSVPNEVDGQSVGYSVAVAADAVQYQGVPPGIGATLLARLPPAAHRATFVDYGCGKGRGLALGMLAGFSRLVGVEMMPDLAGLAERNLRTLRNRHPEQSVRILIQDASTFEPDAGGLVAFLYNPFRGETLRRVVWRLLKHSASHPVWVIYINPQDLETFESLGFTREYEHRRRGTLEAVILVPPPIGATETRSER